MRQFASIVVMSLLLLPFAQAIEFRSDVARGTLIELYTSQGCSSCPPADAWLSELKSHPALWKSVFPIAMHVDYWNNLGWTDPYSSLQNSERQRQYMGRGAVKSVYTPGFVLAGREWTKWFVTKAATQVPKSDKSAGVLAVTVLGEELTAQFKSADVSVYQRLSLNVAVLGFDIKTKVGRGENRGKTLTNDFVMLSKNSAVSSNGRWHLDLPEMPLQMPRLLALVAWVEKPDQPGPIQVTGGWLNVDPALLH